MFVLAAAQQERKPKQSERLVVSPPKIWLVCPKYFVFSLQYVLLVFQTNGNPQFGEVLTGMTKRSHVLEKSTTGSGGFLGSRFGPSDFLKFSSIGIAEIKQDHD